MRRIPPQEHVPTSTLVQPQTPASGQPSADALADQRAAVVASMRQCLDALATIVVWAPTWDEAQAIVQCVQECRSLLARVLDA